MNCLARSTTCTLNDEEADSAASLMTIALPCFLALAASLNADKPLFYASRKQ